MNISLTALNRQVEFRMVWHNSFHILVYLNTIHFYYVKIEKNYNRVENHNKHTSLTRFDSICFIGSPRLIVL